MREPFVEFVQTDLGPDIVLITCGLPASCKTGIAETAQKLKGYPIISTDRVRMEVLKGEDIFDEKIASDMEKRQKVYDEVFRRADETAAKGAGIIIDATFATQSLRRRAAQIAAKHNRPLVIAQTICPQESSLLRIARRTRESGDSNAITEKAYFSNKAEFEEVDLNNLKQLHPNLDILHVTIDTQYDFPENWYVIGRNKNH
ncbi:MAG: ATP-binding protein [Dehalococcoidia bacterium]